MTEQPEVSIIIPTYNNEDTIAICLESLQKQSYDLDEIIVVDGGSDDLTLQICETYDVTVIQSSLGRAAARVKGAEVASSEFLLHIDSDMEVTRNVVEECVEMSREFDALIIPETNVGNTYWAQCTDIGKGISQEKEEGNLRFLRRNTYFSVGGHNTMLLGKEDEELHDMVLNGGFSVGHSDKLIRHHIGQVRLRDILSQRWAYMKSLASYKEHARVDKSTVNRKHRKGEPTLLIKNILRSPAHTFGYILLEIMTTFMAIMNRSMLSKS